MAVCVSFMFGHLGGFVGANVTAFLLDDHCEAAFYLFGTTLISKNSCIKISSVTFIEKLLLTDVLSLIPPCKTSMNSIFTRVNLKLREININLNCFFFSNFQSTSDGNIGIFHPENT